MLPFLTHKQTLRQEVGLSSKMRLCYGSQNGQNCLKKCKLTTS